jgi:hypothetical protein
MFVSPISDINAQSQLMGTGLKNNAITLPLANDDVLNCMDYCYSTAVSLIQQSVELPEDCVDLRLPKLPIHM